MSRIFFCIFGYHISTMGPKRKIIRQFILLSVLTELSHQNHRSVTLNAA
ncbi:Uncharacterized protein dnm_002370 [Desulfonema magnum]|uniref:Uncharacterized protein n=1 Tax=Desulfonema magnum TaxID=45655 RepID=A0A975BFC3_9BACT|nr:Uncharacterized protein dnm_002370 [Desulfonema magnum]